MSFDETAIADMLRRRLAQARPEQSWERLCDAGLAGLHVPPELGGAGLPACAAWPVLQELGFAGLASPFIENEIVAPALLSHSRTDSGDSLLVRMAEGDIVAVAGLERRLRADVSATFTGTRWRLDGEAKLVLDAPAAAHILVAARTEGGGSALLLVGRGQPGLTERAYPTIDDRQAADLLFIDAEAILLNPDAHDAMEQAEDLSLAAIATEAAAVARRLVGLTTEHARQRQQFGQPIGRFQVVQHRLVDMHIQARRLDAIARRALQGLGGHWRERGRLASAAKVTAVEAGRFVSQNAVQLHGAMGMTRELDVGRYVRRLAVIENQLGSAADHRARFARLAA